MHGANYPIFLPMYGANYPIFLPVQRETDLFPQHGSFTIVTNVKNDLEG
jgi:hypothetical protein